MYINCLEWQSYLQCSLMFVVDIRVIYTSKYTLLVWYYSYPEIQSLTEVSRGLGIENRIHTCYTDNSCSISWSSTVYLPQRKRQLTILHIILFYYIESYHIVVLYRILTKFLVINLITCLITSVWILPQMFCCRCDTSCAGLANTCLPQ